MCRRTSPPVDAAARWPRTASGQVVAVGTIHPRGSEVSTLTRRRRVGCQAESRDHRRASGSAQQQALGRESLGRVSIAASHFVWPSKIAAGHPALDPLRPAEVTDALRMASGPGRSGRRPVAAAGSTCWWMVAARAQIGVGGSWACCPSRGSR